jgi:quercetin dioxygenase-like cupin family protein
MGNALRIPSNRQKLLNNVTAQIDVVTGFKAGLSRTQSTLNLGQITSMPATIPPTHLWFLNSLVTVHVSMSESADSISVLEHRGPYGFSPPLHLHRTEDEILHVLEGEFRVKVKDQERRLGPGDIMLAPKNVPHTYRIESKAGGRCLTTTVRGDFERFVRAMSRPAERPELPEPMAALSGEFLQELKTAAAKHGIEFVGPPLQ